MEPPKELLCSELLGESVLRSRALRPNPSRTWHCPVCAATAARSRLE